MKWLSKFLRKDFKKDTPLQLQYVDKAEKTVIEWASKENIRLFQIEFIVPFVLSDKSLEIYLFFDTNQKLQEYSNDQTIEKVRQKFMQTLKGLGYSDDYLSQVNFVIDTDENVRKDYGGSYFARLR